MITASTDRPDDPDEPISSDTLFPNSIPVARRRPDRDILLVAGISALIALLFLFAALKGPRPGAWANSMASLWFVLSGTLLLMQKKAGWLLHTIGLTTLVCLAVLVFVSKCLSDVSGIPAIVFPILTLLLLYPAYSKMIRGIFRVGIGDAVKSIL